MKTKPQVKLENHNYTALIKQSVAEAVKMRLGQVVASRETLMIEKVPKKNSEPKTCVTKQKKVVLGNRGV